MTFRNHLDIRSRRQDLHLTVLVHITEEASKANKGNKGTNMSKHEMRECHSLDQSTKVNIPNHVRRHCSDSRYINNLDMGNWADGSRGLARSEGASSLTHADSTAPRDWP